MGSTVSRIITGLKYSSIFAKSAVMQTWDKQASRQYLLDSLGRMPGISAKAAQLLAMRLGDKSTSDPIKISPMPLSTVKAEIEAHSPALAKEIDEIDEHPLVASLGQVHAATLKSGEQVAIKVQFPNLRRGFAENMQLLRDVSSMGPPRKFRFEMDAIVDYFEQSLLRELDYRIEAESQMEALRLLPPHRSIVIARVFPHYSTETILVQSFEASQSLGEIRERWPESLRRVAARSLLEYFLNGLFHAQLLHTDPHPGNFGFREVSPGTQSHGQLAELVLYDFGSMMKLSRHHAAVLWHMMEAMRKNEEIVPFDYLAALGFDAQKLLSAAQRLPSLMDRLLEPYTRDRAFDFETWGLKSFFERVLAEDKWWFRSAGPPWFLMLMRSAQGFIHGIAKLGVPLAVQDIAQGLEIQLPRQEIPAVLSQLSTGTQAHTGMMARSLFVTVDDPNGENIVDMQLPREAVDEIESFIPEDSLAKILAMGVDLESIKSRVQQSGYLPQKLFETKTDSRSYRVWLE